MNGKLINFIFVNCLAKCIDFQLNVLLNRNGFVQFIQHNILKNLRLIFYIKTKNNYLFLIFFTTDFPDAA